MVWADRGASSDRVVAVMGFWPGFPSHHSESKVLAGPLGNSASRGHA